MFAAGKQTAPDTHSQYTAASLPAHLDPSPSLYKSQFHGKGQQEAPFIQ